MKWAQWSKKWWRQPNINEKDQGQKLTNKLIKWNYFRELQGCDTWAQNSRSFSLDNLTPRGNFCTSPIKYKIATRKEYKIARYSNIKSEWF